MQLRVLLGNKLLVASTATICWTPVLPAQGQADVRGCWHADRPLGPTGGNMPVERDSAYRTFVLRDSDFVQLPTIEPRARRMWEARSWWSIQGDSVTLRVFTGLQGWHASMTTDSSTDTMRGTARYLSDAVVIGRAPTVVAVTLSRVPCDAAWLGDAVSREPLSITDRGEPVYYDTQVDTVASVRGAFPPTVGVLSARPLLRSESARDPLPQSDTAATVLQFIIDRTGRVDTAHAKVLSSTDTAWTQEVEKVLATTSFIPARLKGAPVNQLSQWIFYGVRKEH